MNNPLGVDFADGRDEERTSDFVQMASAFQFAFIKIGEGYVKDPLFDAQWAAAKGNIRRGAFHFFRPYLDPKISAQKTYQYMNGEYGELPIILDIEVTDGRDDTMSRARIWVETMENLSGRQVGVYSQAYFLAENGAGRKNIWGAYKNGWLASHPLWLAAWYYDAIGDDLRAKKIASILSGELSIAFPPVPEPWKAIDFFQWTSRGLPSQVAGYKGACKSVDMDFWNGTKEAFIEKYPIQSKEPPPLPDPIPPEPTPPDPPSPITTASLFGGKVIQKTVEATYNRNGRIVPVKYWLRTMKSSDVKVTFTRYTGILQKTTEVLKKSKADFAINGGGFITYTKRGKPITVIANEENIYLQNGRFTLQKPKGQYQSINYPNILIENGHIMSRPSRSELNPRTVFGWNQNQTTLFVLIVDGRQEMSSGITLDEAAKILLDEGVYTAVAMDSGGSTTLADKQSGIVSLVNSPSDDGETDGQRRVANHILFEVMTAKDVSPSAGTNLAGRYFMLLHDETPRNNFGDPETIGTFTREFNPITPAFEAYWRGLLGILSPEMSKKDFERNWKSLTASDRAFTNGHGWDSGQFALQALICGGATVKAVTGKQIRKSGKLWLEVYAIDPNKLPPLPSSTPDMTLHFYGVISTAVKYKKGLYRKNPFPQFNGRAIVPFVSRGGTALLPYDRLKLLPDFNIPRPFVP